LKNNTLRSHFNQRGFGQAEASMSGGGMGAGFCMEPLDRVFAFRSMRLG
jgi:hypothetical protein